MILFLTLQIFSATGGIEKVCRVAGKSLYEYGLEHNVPIRVFSMHGPQPAARGNRYFPPEIFKGFEGAKIKFVKEAVMTGRKSDTVILSHINLLLAGWLIKKFSPSTKIILIAHGIEVWKPLNKRQKMMLKACDHIISVSGFTDQKIKELHGLTDEKCSVINNCIDPFFTRPAEKKRDPLLMERYGFTDNDIILLTLTRLSEKDRYKGYDRVLLAIAGLTAANHGAGYPGKKIKYLLAGGCDDKEKIFVDGLIADLGIGDHVVLAGYVKEEELPAHFSMADIYVMPSVKEGFGIVFVEAMYYDVPAIAGNADGSADALLNGRLGILINPYNAAAITDALSRMIDDPIRYRPDRKLLDGHFSYETYKMKLEQVLQETASRN